MLLGILEGLPAGIPLEAAFINRYLARRQGGYGRGGRQKIEKDEVRIVAGVRHGETLGSPLGFLLENRDFAHWQGVMDPEREARDEEKAARRAVKEPRPGHADLVGGLKYDRADLRDILERASARETAMKVALGAAALRFLEELDIHVAGYVVAMGEAAMDPGELEALSFWERRERAAGSPVYCPSPRASEAMVEAVREAARRNDTLGGVVEVMAVGLPVGLGSHIAAERRLEGRLAAALMALPAVKGVEVGLGFGAAYRYGSQVHDAIYREAEARRKGGYTRSTNRAGGLEGGITNGMPLVVRLAMKPLSTLTHPLPTVNIVTKEPSRAAVERTDVAAVPALSVVAEAAVGLVLADAVLEKFGGDSLKEVKRNLEGFLAQMEAHPSP